MTNKLTKDVWFTATPFLDKNRSLKLAYVHISLLELIITHVLNRPTKDTIRLR
jgi:hypothetical protein